MIFLLEATIKHNPTHANANEAHKKLTAMHIYEADREKRDVESIDHAVSRHLQRLMDNAEMFAVNPEHEKDPSFGGQGAAPAGPDHVQDGEITQEIPPLSS